MSDSVLYAPASVKADAPWRERWFPNNEWVLLAVILAECAIFSLTGYNFLTPANAVKQSGRRDVKVTGLSLPSMCKPYIKQDIIESCVPWNTADPGYLTVHAANALTRGELSPGDKELEAGRLGQVEVAEDEVRLGAPFIFNKSNVDQFNF